MAFRFKTPNKPITSGVGIFDMIDDSYVVESKLDGWRIISHKDDKLKTVSRKNKTIEVNKELKELMTRMIPNNCCIDCEWINEKRIKAINKELGTKIDLVNFIIIIDIIYYDNVYLNDIDLINRKNKKLNLKIKRLQLSDLLNMSKLNNGIFWPPSCKGSMGKSFFLNQNNYPISEGVVIKKLQGNLKSTWTKIKYR